MKFDKYVNEFRKNNVPKKYNQIELMNHLTDENLDHYFSISNRADGKSFNYIHFLLNLSNDFNVGFMLISRKYTLRHSYISLIQKIVDKSNILNEKKLSFLNTQNYVKVLYVDRTIAVITDLNSATNLKYDSNFLDDFPIIVYDEFLAIEGDYLPDEWERLKTIYGSVNRGNEIPIIKFPKLVYLGNAVNFSSPILSNLNLFHRLENQPINTLKLYGNVAIEMRYNKSRNEDRNLRAFDEENDRMSQGQFEANNHNIVTDFERKQLSKDRHYLMIKLEQYFLRVDYNLDNKIIVLSVLGFSESYDFNTEIKDNKEKSIFLDDYYYKQSHQKRYEKGLYKFDNNYSRDTITSNLHLMHLNLMKVIKKHELAYKNVDRTEEKYHDNYIERTKKSLFKKFSE